MKGQREVIYIDFLEKMPNQRPKKRNWWKKSNYRKQIEKYSIIRLSITMLYQFQNATIYCSIGQRLQLQKIKLQGKILSQMDKTYFQVENSFTQRTAW